jgi:phage repressor protein C with HTH and peptisase S24 domain
VPNLTTQPNAVLRIAYAPPVRLPYFGKHLLAGSKGAIEYLPLVEWREVRLLFKPGPNVRLVCAEICGDSLHEALIADGDMAVIELTHEARDGELVAALTPQGILVKYLYREPRGWVRLESRNAAYEPHRFKVGEVRIQGVIRQIVRKLG